MPKTNGNKPTREASVDQATRPGRGVPGESHQTPATTCRAWSGQMDSPNGANATTTPNTTRRTSAPIVVGAVRPPFRLQSSAHCIRCGQSQRSPRSWSPRLGFVQRRPQCPHRLPVVDAEPVQAAASNVNAIVPAIDTSRPSWNLFTMENRPCRAPT